MNVGETDSAKNGKDLADDSGDKYDDTHAILSLGLTGGPSLRSKTKTLGMETYNSDRFQGSGPIDCIYAFGAGEAQISSAARGFSTFNSDHFPVWVDWTTSATELLTPTSLNSPPVSTNTATLRIGAWNIENLGTRAGDSQSVDQDPNDLANYIIDSGVAIRAVEEIHDDEQDSSDHSGTPPWENDILAQALLIVSQRTGSPWTYALTPPSSSNTRQQLTGVAWDTGRATLLGRRLAPVSGGTLNQATLWTRQPEAFHFSLGTGKTDFALIPLHMKSNSDGENLGRAARASEAQQLIAALPALKTALQNESDIILLGDTNMKAGETTARDHWGAGFKDLNQAELYTYIKPFRNEPFPPFDRIFVPLNQPEFTNCKQIVHGPYGNGTTALKEWRREHLRKRSDHLLVWTDIVIMNDDD